MQGASRQALDRVRERLDALLGAGDLPGGVDAAAVGDDLLAVTAFLDRQPSVRRALVDVGRTEDDRAGLARRLLAGSVGEPAVDLVAGAVRDRWARPSHLAAALEELGIDAHLSAADRDGRLDAVEDELFRFSRTVDAQPALRGALGDAAAPVNSRRALVRRLLEGRAAPTTVRLVEHAVLARRERSLDAAMARLGELAAGRKRHEVALVRVATPLSDEHRDRLARALAARRGTAIHLNVVVEPDVVGGLRVEVGDEVYDASVASRLDDARRRLAG